MKFVLCCLLLLFANMVFAATVRAERENVLSFLNDAFGTMNVPANVPAHTNAPSKPVTDDNSEDTSDANSSEDFDKKGFAEPVQPSNNGGDSTGAVKDRESHEIMAMNENPPPRRKTGVDKGSVGTMDMSRELIQDHGSREWTDLDSEEETAVDKQKGGNLSGKHINGPDHQRKAERVRVLDRELTLDESRDLPDWDSTEENKGRLAAAVKETREHTSPLPNTSKRADANVPERSQTF